MHTARQRSSRTTAATLAQLRAHTHGTPSPTPPTLSTSVMAPWPAPHIMPAVQITGAAWSIDTVLKQLAPSKPPPQAAVARPPPRLVAKSLITLLNGPSMFAQAVKIAGLAPQLIVTSFKGTVLVPSDAVSGFLVLLCACLGDVHLRRHCCCRLCLLKQVAIGCWRRTPGHAAGLLAQGCTVRMLCMLRPFIHTCSM
jgi:hypothetical protein